MDPNSRTRYRSILEPAGVRYTLSVPEPLIQDEPLPLMLILHWGGYITPYYGQSILAGLFEPALGEMGALMAAPDCPSADWTTPDCEKGVLALLDHLSTLYPVDPDKILIAGYSMGGIGSWHIASRNQDRFSCALPVSARPPVSVLEQDWTIPLYVIHSKQDELFPYAQTQSAVNELKERGTSIKLVLLDGPTHFDTSGYLTALSDSSQWIRSSWIGSG